MAAKAQAASMMATDCRLSGSSADAMPSGDGREGTGASMMATDCRLSGSSTDAMPSGDGREGTGGVDDGYRLPTKRIVGGCNAERRWPRRHRGVDDGYRL